MNERDELKMCLNILTCNRIAVRAISRRAYLLLGIVKGHTMSLTYVRGRDWECENPQFDKFVNGCLHTTEQFM